MLMHHHWDPALWTWALSTPFGIMVFTMVFLTWTLIIVNLFFLTIMMVHKIFGKNGIVQNKK